MKAMLLLTAAIVVFATGCATTERVEVKNRPTICAFLGESCDKMTAGGEGQKAGLRWINPSAKLTQYNKVIVDVVGFFGSEAPKVSPKEEEALTTLFKKTLVESMAKRFQVVEEAGPGTMRLQVALLDAEAATAGMRSITMVIPQARLLSTGAYAVTGKYPFTGGGEAAAKLTDSVTGEVLALAADRRVGGGSIKTAGQWQWGDAENVIKEWSELASNGIYAYTSGAVKP
ncbi:MAG TPA: DUF3313 domain-containing protein [Methylomirabilota bacterium]|nr:DUF3313 domain-containing protein [Methylomirabilota bacterium]